MIEFFAKLRHLFKGETLKNIERGTVTTAARAIEDQMIAHDEAAMKKGEVPISRKVTGLVVETYLTRRENVANMLFTTAEKMDLESTGDEFAEKLEGAKKKNPDFFNFFFDSVKNVSNEEVRQYWEAILKGELEQPDSMSVSVVDILRKLDKDVAIIFDKAYQFHCEDWIYVDLNKQFPISLHEIQRLTESGLVLPPLFGQVIKIDIDENGCGNFSHCGIKVVAERTTRSGIPQIPVLRFTTSGFLLAKTINKKRLPNMAYLAKMAKFVGSEEMQRSTLDNSMTGKFRLWIALQSGGRILIDPEKKSGGINCHWTSSGEIEVTKTSR